MAIYMSETPIAGLAHVAIKTHEMEKTIRFYTEIFPFEILQKASDSKDESDLGAYNQVILRCGDLYLEILRADQPTEHDGKPGPIHHLGISVHNVVDALDFLKTRGLPENSYNPPTLKTNLNPVKPYRSAGITGPNGEILGLYEINNAVYFQ